MVSLEDFKYGGTNLTAFRLVDPEREEVRQVYSKFGVKTFKIINFVGDCIGGAGLELWRVSLRREGRRRRHVHGGSHERKYLLKKLFLKKYVLFRN